MQQEPQQCTPATTLTRVMAAASPSLPIQMPIQMLVPVPPQVVVQVPMPVPMKQWVRVQVQVQVLVQVQLATAPEQMLARLPAVQQRWERHRSMLVAKHDRWCATKLCSTRWTVV